MYCLIDALVKTQLCIMSVVAHYNVHQECIKVQNCGISMRKSVRVILQVRAT